MIGDERPSPTTSALWGISALYLGVPEQELHGSEVTSAPVDKHCLCSAQRVRTELRRIKPDAGDPLLHEPCVLTCCEAALAVPASRKQDLTCLPTRQTEVLVDGRDVFGPSFRSVLACRSSSDGLLRDPQNNR